VRRERGSIVAQARVELWLLWRGFVLPAALVICALMAIANVTNDAGTVRADYALVQHTRAQYAANGMDFAEALKRPAVVTTTGGEQSVSNLARYDYDTMASAVLAISPASSVTEVLGYFTFLIFPLAFFLIGLWLATGQRRYGIEKVTLVRTGANTTIAARQLAVIAAATLVIAAVLLVDVIARTIVSSALAGQLPLRAFHPLAAASTQNVASQWGLAALTVLFFGGAGIAVGTFAGVFALPALVFLVWDYVVPFLGAHDPRNWFDVLGHSVFSYTGAFALSPGIPLAQPVALAAASGGTVALLALGYVGIRIRNPLAT
jgi:hypothetical protein